MIREEITRPREDRLEALEAISPNDLGHYVDFGHVSPEIEYMNTADSPTLVGSAVTVRIPPEDATMVHKAIEFVQPGDVLVVDMQGHVTNACWGEMTTQAAIVNGAVGAVIDGSLTDVTDVRSLDFPVFARGTSTRTCRIQGRGGDVNLPVQIGGAVVEPGDAVLANEDGILFVPRDEIEQAIQLCADKKDREADRIKRLKDGESLADQSGANDLLDSGGN